MTALAIPVPNGCRWCGVDFQEHCQRYHPEGGRHGWTAPTDEQRLARMRARREAAVADRTCTRCGGSDAVAALPKQFRCGTCGNRLLCYACDVTHNAWCGVGVQREVSRV